MVRILLSSLMVATQLLSWNASPRFLCKSQDGSTCIDLGPATCDCCHDEVALAKTPAADHDGCLDHPACDQGSGGTDFDACPCTHVQLSEAHSATLQRAAAVPDAHRLVILLPLAAHVANAACQPATSGDAAGPWQPLNSRGEMLATLASVVMRC
jgi:hypothetical protein